MVGWSNENPFSKEKKYICGWSYHVTIAQVSVEHEKLANLLNSFGQKIG